MKVTVCELNNDPEQFERDWLALTAHVNGKQSELLVLPEMPFCPWLAATENVDPAAWQVAVETHEQWLERLSEMEVPVVLGSRPVVRDQKRHNEGFVWQRRLGLKDVHTKYYLPDEAGFWEASWYERGDGAFEAIELNGTQIGFLICTELWFTTRAREYAAQGAELIVCPRVTPMPSVEMWLAGGQAAAIVSGAYCLSSNLRSQGAGALNFGGTGWIIEPEYGRVLGTTSADRPFLTLDIDLEVARLAKHTYPRYVSE